MKFINRFACATYSGKSPFLTDVFPKASTNLDSNSDKKVAIKNKETFCLKCGVAGPRTKPYGPYGTSICYKLSDDFSIIGELDYTVFQSEYGYNGFHNLTFKNTDPATTTFSFSVSKTKHAKYTYKAILNMDFDNYGYLWINNNQILNYAFTQSITLNSATKNDVYKFHALDDKDNPFDNHLFVFITLFYK